MRPALAAFASGFLFGLGLAVAQMVDPAKIIGFLDLAGAWDPSLVLVLGGATGTTLITFRYVLRRPAPLLVPRWALPGVRQVDAPLIVGSALFGIGWGLAGFCPGPAIASLGYGSLAVVVFVGAMVAGFALAPVVSRSLTREDG